MASVLKSFGRGLQISGQKVGELASKDPFFGATVGFIAGGATGNPLAAFAGGVSGGAAGALGKQTREEESEALLTAQTEQQALIAKASEFADPRRKTILTGQAQNSSLLG